MFGQKSQRFLTAEGGSIAILVALLMSITMLFAGLALDMARLLKVRQTVQSSLDAAALAAAKRFEEPGITEQEIQETAERYFEANVGSIGPGLAKLKNFKAIPNMLTSQVIATVDVDMPTMLAPGGMTGITNSTFTPTAGTIFTQTRIEVAMVLDITGSMFQTSIDGRVKLETLKTAAKEFADVLYAGRPRLGYVRVAIVPYSASVNAGSNAANLAGPGSDTCVVERPGSNAYNDAVADGLDKLGRSDSAQAYYYSCAPSEVEPLSDLSTASKRASYDASIDALQAGGGTAGHIGLAWGWYVLSDKWASVWGAAAGASPSTKVRKVIVLLTDGVFNSAYNNGGSVLAPGSVTDPNMAGSSPYQALQICKKVQSDGGIKIYTVGFSTPPEAAELLKKCAGEENFYDANDSGKLLSSFRSIASKLISLRLSS